MLIIVPEELRQYTSVWCYRCYLNQLVNSGGPIDEIKVFDLRKSIHKAGLACLRLCMALNKQELQAVNPCIIMNNYLFSRLNECIDSYYLDRLTQNDLADGIFLREGCEALDLLTVLFCLRLFIYYNKKRTHHDNNNRSYNI